LLYDPVQSLQLSVRQIVTTSEEKSSFFSDR
jgi:hypothetical protein